jgi:hypothetical protein
MSHGFNVLMENLVLRFYEKKAVILTGRSRVCILIFALFKEEILQVFLFQFFVTVLSLHLSACD